MLDFGHVRGLPVHPADTDVTGSLPKHVDLLHYLSAGGQLHDRALAVAGHVQVAVDVASHSVQPVVLELGEQASVGQIALGRDRVLPDHPLLALDNVTIAPHLGSATEQTRQRMAEISVENLLAGLAGQPLVYEVTV